MFAGLAIQVEKPLRVGHWITVGPFEGLVSEVTWRATKIRTKQATSSSCRTRSFAKKPSQLLGAHRADAARVEVGVSYGVPPDQVKAALVEAVGNAPLRCQILPRTSW